MTTDGSLDSQLRSGGSTSRSLLADARLAVPEAWERLVRLYAPLVSWWCRRWGIGEQDVADLLQEVFLSVASRLDRFHKEQPQDTFRGWLFTITRNKVRDHLRRRAAEPAAQGGPDNPLDLLAKLEADPESGPPSFEADGILNDLLRRALDSIHGEFHERTWQAFWGVVVEGRAAADVAADLEMTPGAVRVAKSRVLLRLRRELGDAPG